MITYHTYIPYKQENILRDIFSKNTYFSDVNMKYRYFQINRLIIHFTTKYIIGSNRRNQNSKYQRKFRLNLIINVFSVEFSVSCSNIESLTNHNKILFMHVINKNSVECKEIKTFSGKNLSQSPTLLYNPNLFLQLIKLNLFFQLIKLNLFVQ